MQYDAAGNTKRSDLASRSENAVFRWLEIAAERSGADQLTDSDRQWLHDGFRGKLDRLDPWASIYRTHLGERIKAKSGRFRDALQTSVLAGVFVGIKDIDEMIQALLDPLFNDPEAAPTPNEIEAPGLWLARVSPDLDA